MFTFNRFFKCWLWSFLSLHHHPISIFEYIFYLRLFYHLFKRIKLFFVMFTILGFVSRVWLTHGIILVRKNGTYGLNRFLLQPKTTFCLSFSLPFTTGQIREISSVSPVDSLTLLEIGTHCISDATLVWLASRTSRVLNMDLLNSQ